MPVEITTSITEIAALNFRKANNSSSHCRSPTKVSWAIYQLLLDYMMYVGLNVTVVSYCVKPVSKCTKDINLC